MESRHDAPVAEKHTWSEPPSDEGAGVALKMGMHRVHTHFYQTLLLCVVCLGLCYPRWGDRPRALALREVNTLTEQIDLPALRRTLARDGARRLVPDFRELEGIVGAERLSVPPTLKPQEDFLVAEQPGLGSLSSLAAAARGGAQITAKRPSLQALGTSLRYRLELQKQRTHFTLTSLKATHGIAEEAVQAELRVEPARRAEMTALAAFERAREHYFSRREVAERLAAQRRSERAREAANYERMDAWRQFESTQRSAEATRIEYEQLAAEAQRTALAPSPQGTFGREVVATLLSDHGAILELRIPVPLETLRTTSSVSLPDGLMHLQQSPLWTHIEKLSPEDAAKQLRRELSWHMKQADILGLPLSGSLVLHILPLLVGLMTGLLAWTCRTVSREYNPFSFAEIEVPQPGTGQPKLDTALLVAAPTLVCLLTCLTLLRLGERPLLTSILCAAVILEAWMAALALSKMEAVRSGVRYRSLLPPLPVRNSAAE